MSDACWALIEPVFTAWRAKRTGPGTAPRVHDLREIVNAIFYVTRTGIPWEYLPHHFPNCRTVYDYYAKWKADGTTQQVHGLLQPPGPGGCCSWRAAAVTAVPLRAVRSHKIGQAHFLTSFQFQCVAASVADTIKLRPGG